MLVMTADRSAVLGRTICCRCYYLLRRCKRCGGNDAGGNGACGELNRDRAVRLRTDSDLGPCMHVRTHSPARALTGVRVRVSEKQLQYIVSAGLVYFRRGVMTAYPIFVAGQREDGMMVRLTAVQESTISRLSLLRPCRPKPPTAPPAPKPPTKPLPPPAAQPQPTMIAPGVREVCAELEAPGQQA